MKGFVVMAWVNYEYYKNEYLIGRAPKIVESDFAFYEKQAREAILSYNSKRPTIEEAPDYLKNCTCEIAEAIHDHGSSADKNAQSKIRETMRIYISETPLHNALYYKGR